MEDDADILVLEQVSLELALDLNVAHTVTPSAVDASVRFVVNFSSKLVRIMSSRIRPNGVLV